MTYHNKTNRKFLKQLFFALSIVILGFILWAAVQYLFFRPDSNTITIGTFSHYKKNQIIHKKKERFYIIRDSSGLYAVSDVCTHRGCMVLIKDNTFECPCHSAVFTLEGRPLSGPADKPLDHYYIYKNKQDVLVVDVTKSINKEIRYSE